MLKGEIEMENLRFSIIIPSYNSVDEIGRAIQSIREQTFKNYEIIVVDDCSTDNTYETLSKEKDIKVIRNSTNLKAGGARNKGLEVAKGEYIIFLDADDYFAEKATLQKINDVIGNERTDIVYLGFEIVGRIQEKWIPTEENSTISQRAQNWKYENVWDVCWNHEFLKENNMSFVEKRYFEDFVFYYTGIMRAKTYKVASFVTHIYTMYKSDSITSKVSEEKLQDLYINVIQFLEELKNIPPTKEKADIVYAVYRVVEYSTRLLRQYENDLRTSNS